MAVTNGVGGFNTGRDCSVVLVSSLYGRVDIPNVTHFDCKQDTASVKVDRLDGILLNAELPKGWNWRIEAERANSALDDLMAKVEDAWHTLGVVAFFTLYQYVTESDSSTSTWQMDNCSLKFDDPGDWKSDASVKQRISGMANRRRRV